MSEATLLKGFRPLFAEIEGRRIRYYTAGAGEPLLLVHGLGGAAVNWTELGPLLAHRRRVIVPDLPGHGESEGILDGAGLGAYADGLAALLELEGARPAAVAGHSMGGVVAIHLAVGHPESVAALALLGSAGISSTTRRAEVFIALTARLRPVRKAARLRHLVAARPRLRRLVFGYWGAADPAALSPQSVLGFLQGAASATDFPTAARALLRDDPRSHLDRVRCPSLVVWGARDRLAPLEDGFEYARRFRAPIRVVAGAGHLLIGERPEECASILEDFLEAVSV